jgi:hypothetical protein
LAAEQVLRALEEAQLDSVKQVMVAEKVVDFDKVAADRAAAAAAAAENRDQEDLLTNLVFNPLGLDLRLVRQVAQAEEDLLNTAQVAAEAQVKQELVDRVVPEDQVAQEFKMLFKLVQINIMLAEAAAELGKWLQVQAAKEEAETALSKITKEQLLPQQDLVLAEAEMAANTEQVDLVQLEL